LKEIIEFDTLEIEHRINRRLKHIYITVDADANVIIKSPGSSRSRLQELLERKKGWIEKQRAKSANALVPELGKELLFHGELVPIYDDPRFISLSEALLRLRKRDEESIRRCYHDFYKASAMEHLPQRVEHYSAMMGLSPSALRYRRMKSQWGNCNVKRIVTFNTLLVQLNPACIDYVVVHELAHLKHMNHSKAFHALVERHFPDAGNVRKKIKAFRAKM
jgi:predicted metal-dependent hydrolase